MRGQSSNQSSMICLISPETSVPAEHPIRAIRQLADAALRTLTEVFDEMYAATGRPSVPPERLLKGQLLIALYSIRSERQLCEQLKYNLLFRWFLDMDMLEPAFDASTYSRNRDRLMSHDVAAAFFAAVREQARDLMSHEHFSVDGTLIEAWASLKSFRRKGEDGGDNNGWGDFRGEKRSNETHASTTDPESRLLRKGNGQPARLSYLGHALVENRHGLLVDLRVSTATGTAEREVAIDMLAAHDRPRRTTLGADRGYDTGQFVDSCRELGVTPHRTRRTARQRSTNGPRDTSATRSASGCGCASSRCSAGARPLAASDERGYAASPATYLIAAAYNLLRVSKLRREAAP